MLCRRFLSLAFLLSIHPRSDSSPRLLAGLPISLPSSQWSVSVFPMTELELTGLVPCAVFDCFARVDCSGMYPCFDDVWDPSAQGRRPGCVEMQCRALSWSVTLSFRDQADQACRPRWRTDNQARQVSHRSEIQLAHPRFPPIGCPRYSIDWLAVPMRTGDDTGKGGTFDSQGSVRTTEGHVEVSGLYSRN